jgi:hypothetical protein
MFSIPRSHGFARIVAVIFIVMWFSYGCHSVGPYSISRGRPDYNEAINRTDLEQMLMTIVRHRYTEPSSMLAVATVTANVRVRASAGVQVGLGASDNYAGNLVPLRGGFAYEENPTISYMPVQGEQYLRQLMSPVPLDIFVMFMRSMTSPELPFAFVVNRINKISNPGFLPSPTEQPDVRFARLVDLFMDLRHADRLFWGAHPQKSIDYAVVIHGYEPSYSGQVRELLSLLDLSMPAVRSKPIILPVTLSVVEEEVYGISVSTRSVYDMIEILAASVVVPEEHVRSGLCFQFPRRGLVGAKLSIRRSEKRPQNASVAVQYRGSWFYIDETDQSTKRVFRMLYAFWNVRIASTADHLRAAPVLTIPVGN